MRMRHTFFVSHIFLDSASAALFTIIIAPKVPHQQSSALFTRICVVISIVLSIQFEDALFNAFIIAALLILLLAVSSSFICTVCPELVKFVPTYYIERLFLD